MAAVPVALETRLQRVRVRARRVKADVRDRAGAVHVHVRHPLETKQVRF
jgi:hypothetical protein